MRTLWWMSEDLRLRDNALIDRATRAGDQLVVVWTPSPSQDRAFLFRKAHLEASLWTFSKSLREAGANLYGSRVFCPSQSWMKNFIFKNQIEKVYRTRSWGAEELHLEYLASTWKIEWEWVDQNSLLPMESYDPERLRTDKVFTDWRRRWEKSLLVPSEPQLLQGNFLSAGEEDLLPLDETKPQFLHPRIASSESGAKEALESYFQGDLASSYKLTRNGLIRWEDSTKLSPYLALGLLSPHSVLRLLNQYEKDRGTNESTEHLRMELMWREYFRRIMALKGVALFAAAPRYPLAEDVLALDLLCRWKAGETGVDFLDAHMTELRLTGWMSNRGRQNVASYLTKSLGVDWRWGAKYFEEVLIDYDVHSNWGNWAYLAGVGQDPRDRVFNPVAQAARYDPEGIYTSYWLRKRRE